MSDAVQGWRVGHRMKINVYDQAGNPVGQCQSEEYAAQIVAAVNQRAELLAENERLTKALIHETRQRSTKPDFATFVELKNGIVGTILWALQNGEISRGKAAEALAEVAHGATEVSLPKIPDAIPDDAIPLELLRERDALQSRLDEWKALGAETPNAMSVVLDAGLIAEREALRAIEKLPVSDSPTLTLCTRPSEHDGPCNGWRRKDCGSLVLRERDALRQSAEELNRRLVQVCAEVDALRAAHVKILKALKYLYRVYGCYMRTETEQQVTAAISEASKLLPEVEIVTTYRTPRYAVAHNLEEAEKIIKAGGGHDCKRIARERLKLTQEMNYHPPMKLYMVLVQTGQQKLK